MNGMKKVAKIGKIIGITFLVIGFLSTCIYFTVDKKAAKKLGTSDYVLASAEDYSGVVASTNINNSDTVAISDIATSLYAAKTFSRSDTNVTSRTDSDRTSEDNKMNPENVPSVVSSIEEEIQKEIVENGKVDLDEKVEKIIDILANEGKTDIIPSHLGKDEEKQREYLKAFIKASYSTKFPDLNRGNSELDGIIKFKRGNDYLEYKPYDEFMELVNENNDDSLKYFSLKYENQVAKLILATWSENGEGERTYYLLEPINYQKELNLFAMPFDFIWAMLIVSHNKDFAYDLANLAINESSIIEIEIVDTELNYNIEITEDVEGETEGNDEEIVEESEESEEEQTEEGDELSTYISKENVVNIVVKKADTWLLQYVAEYEIIIGEKSGTSLSSNYTAKTDEELQEYLDKLPDELPEKRKKVVETALSAVGKIPYYWGGLATMAGLEGNDFGSTVSDDGYGRTKKGLDCSHFIDWVFWTALGDNLGNGNTTNIFNMRSKEVSAEEIKIGDIGFFYNPLEAAYMNKVNHVGIYLGDGYWVHCDSGEGNVVVNQEPNFKYFRIVDSLVWETATENGDTDNVETENSDENANQNNNVQLQGTKSARLKITKQSAKEKLDKDTEEENFVTIFNKKEYKSMQKNITSGASWLYEILRQSEDTVEMVDTVKYILYKATGNEKFAGVEMNWSELVDFSGFGSSSFYSNGTGFWWPIGSSATETIKGKLFATGEPSLSTVKCVFGYSAAYFNYTTFHSGIDISDPGKHYIIASAGGTVTAAVNTYTGSTYNGGDGPKVYGNYIVIDHGNGYHTLYGHLKYGTVKVSVGDVVEQGQVIAEMGNTGYSTGPHLHFEMRSGAFSNKSYVDPLEYVDPSKPRPKGSELRNWIIAIEGGIDGKYVDGDNYIVYDGKDGVLTVGYGIVIVDQSGTQKYKNLFSEKVTAGTRIPKSTVDKMYDQFKAGSDEKLASNIEKLGLNLTSYQQHAILSTMYNCGNGVCYDLLKAYKDGGNEGYWKLLKEYKWAKINGVRQIVPGLQRRRIEEYELFTRGDYNYEAFSETKINKYY